MLLYKLSRYCNANFLEILCKFYFRLIVSYTMIPNTNSVTVIIVGGSLMESTLAQGKRTGYSRVNTGKKTGTNVQIYSEKS